MVVWHGMSLAQRLVQRSGTAHAYTCEILAISLFSLMIYDLGPLLHTFKTYMSERQGLCRLTD